MSFLTSVGSASYFRRASWYLRNKSLSKRFSGALAALISGDFLVEGSPIGATQRRADSNQCGS